MDIVDAICLLFIGTGLFAVVMYYCQKTLRDKFISLGVLNGRTMVEIVSVVGLPNSRMMLSNGTELCQWISERYHIALLFEGDICIGIQHEFAG